MKSIYFQQTKPTTVVILGVLFLLFSLLSFKNINEFLILFFIGIILLGYNISYKISADFNNKKVFTFFNIPLFKRKFILEFPDYISLFQAGYSKPNEWGPVSALGTFSETDMLTIRFFSGNQNTTIYKSGSFDKVEMLAKELSEMLGVELYDPNK